MMKSSKVALHTAVFGFGVVGRAGGNDLSNPKLASAQLELDDSWNFCGVLVKHMLSLNFVPRSVE